MTDAERIKLGLTKKLTYRYAYGSGDIHNAGNKSTYFLRAMARMGLYGPSTEKYFTPDSVKAIKAKEKDPNFQTKLVNPIYISDAQVPLEDFEIVETGGQALYDYDEEPPRFLGFAPVNQTKKVIRAAERNLSPPGTKFGLEGSNGNSSIPEEGTTNDIKKIKASNFYYTSSRQNGAVPAKFEAVITLAGVKNTFVFDATGYITVLGVRYSALQVLNEFDDKTALNWFREQLKGDTEANNILDSWGLIEQQPVEPEKKEGIPDREEDADGDPNAEKEENKTDEEVKTQTDTSSITEKINILRGWVVKDGKVQYDKNGKPKKSNDKNPQLRVSDTVNITIESDGSVNIDGDVQINVADKKDAVRLVENGKFTIPFGKINGNFNCQKVGLTTLANAPKIVNGTFDCTKNDLTTLVGAPQEVGRFIATDIKSLKSLAGGPKVIKGITDTNKSQKEYIYDISGCGLTTLEGNGITSFGPGGFNCSGNKLTSLTGLGVVATTGVTKFDCSNNELTSLNGIPKPVKDAKTGKPGDYWIRGNVGITVFPASMADFEVEKLEAGGLSLTSLSFAPKQVYGNFDCSGNKGTTKLTNQSIGKDRFKVGGGFEEDAGNRIVKIDGEFITSEGIWGDKTYDINTQYKKSETSSVAEKGEAASSTPAGQGPGGKLFKLNKPGGAFTHGPVYLVEIPDPLTIKLGYKYDGTGKGADSWRHIFTKRSPSGWLGAGFKNFINFSFFEGSCEGWTAGQPTGVFLINGENKGAKTWSRTWQNMFYKPKGGKPLLGKSASAFYVGLQNPDWGGADSKADPKANGKFIQPCGTNKGLTGGGTYTSLAKQVEFATGGGKNMITNGNVVADVSVKGYNLYTAWPFIGYTTDGQYFAGVSTPNPVLNKRTVNDGSWRIDEISKAVNDHFKSKGKTVSRCINGDGGGSGALALNGQIVMEAEGRSVPVIISW